MTVASTHVSRVSDLVDQMSFVLLLLAGWFHGQRLERGLELAQAVKGHGVEQAYEEGLANDRLPNRLIVHAQPLQDLLPVHVAHATLRLVPVACPALLALELVDAERGEGPLDVRHVLDPAEGRGYRILVHVKPSEQQKDDGGQWTDGRGDLLVPRDGSKEDAQGLGRDREEQDGEDEDQEPVPRRVQPDDRVRDDAEHQRPDQPEGLLRQQFRKVVGPSAVGSRRELPLHDELLRREHVEDGEHLAKGVVDHDEEQGSHPVLDPLLVLPHVHVKHADNDGEEDRSADADDEGDLVARDLSESPAEQNLELVELKGPVVTRAVRDVRLGHGVVLQSGSVGRLELASFLFLEVGRQHLDPSPRLRLALLGPRVHGDQVEVKVRRVKVKRHLEAEGLEVPDRLLVRASKVDQVPLAQEHDEVEHLEDA
mmetsp:Transcript_1517/g.4381  ORF Transcript_1517/g.4381 Transcript_1517/m.4381 type:complete len:426 (-) Transcript_1517:640-1917(-)